MTIHSPAVVTAVGSAAAHTAAAVPPIASAPISTPTALSLKGDVADSGVL